MQVDDTESDALVERIVAIAARLKAEGKRPALLELIARMEKAYGLSPIPIDKVDTES